MSGSNSPLDVSDTPYDVYFEVSDRDLCIQTLQNSEAAALMTNITMKDFGFHLSVVNQHIPEIIKILVAAGHAVYQVKRQPVFSESNYMI